MSRIEEFYIKYLSWINAYWPITIVFLIVTFTVDDSSLCRRYTYDKRMHSLGKEIKHCRKEIEINSKKLNDLHTDKEGLKRFACGECLMKRSNEDVLIIRDKQMNQQIRSIIFGIAGLLILAGAILFLIRWAVAPYLFAVGAVGIAVCYLTLPAKDLGFRCHRLHRFNVFAGFLMIVSSGFMSSNRTEWTLCLSVAAILQIYTAFVTPKE